MGLALKPGTEWRTVYGRARAAAPEAFGDEGPLNYWGGRWRPEGEPEAATSPIDGSAVTGPPRLDAGSAHRAVRDSFHEHRTWRVASLEDRKARVSASVDALAAHRELLALLLVWETGKTWASAGADVDRCVDGVRRCLGKIDGLLEGRSPSRGPVADVADGEHPMGVLMRAMLVQALAGSAVIAEAPADGGANCLTLAIALAGRHGLPFTLLSGTESSAVLEGSHVISKRIVLAGIGPKSWGIPAPDSPLAERVRQSFEDGSSSRRYVVLRSLSEEFLAAYLPLARSRVFGHPLAVESPEDSLPALGSGPVISDRKVKDLLGTVDEAIGGGAVPLCRGEREAGKFIPGQDKSAYFPPVSILGPPTSSPLYRGDPGGPVDVIVLVDTVAELPAETGVSAGVEELVHAVTH
jgi:acyl-CoA reductase-like NAD-dependent aldehyde dehydrogenase